MFRKIQSDVTWIRQP